MKYRCLLQLVWILSIAASGRADQKSPEEALQDKGLRRLNYYFALVEESDLSKGLRAADSLKRKAFDAHQKAAQAKTAVDEKKKLMIGYLQQRRQLRARLPLARTVEQHNQIVSALNELADRLVIMQTSDREEKALDQARAALSTAVERYVQQVLQLRQLYDQVKKRYEALAADPAVAKAIQEYNKTSSRTYRVGPSALFSGNGRKLQSLEKTVLSESIKLRRGAGGLWYVTAMFNGKFPQEIAIDTGASVIALPWKTAQAVGLAPDADDPPVRVQVADGRVLEARRVVAETVRVGKFTAQNVECAVMPQGMPGATPLLGLSFFKNFSFKIDSAKGQLIMSQIEAPQPKKPARSSRPRRPTRRPTP